MTSVAKALDIPVVVTQQYTKVFGPTVEDVFADQEHFKSCKTFEKKNFSMCTDEVKSHLSALNKKSVVLFGIEAHVCVQQTCLDLLEEGVDVHLIADGISSQQPYDREIALQRMSQAGAFLTTAQSTAFMLMRSAEHANFKGMCNGSISLRQRKFIVVIKCKNYSYLFLLVDLIVSILFSSFQCYICSTCSQSSGE